MKHIFFIHNIITASEPFGAGAKVENSTYLECGAYARVRICQRSLVLTCSITWAGCMCDCSFVECANMVYDFCTCFKHHRNVIIIIIHWNIDDQPKPNNITHMHTNKQWKHLRKRKHLANTLEGCMACVFWSGCRCCSFKPREPKRNTNKCTSTDNEEKKQKQFANLCDLISTRFNVQLGAHDAHNWGSFVISWPLNSVIYSDYCSGHTIARKQK